MLITDSRKIIDRMAERLLTASSDLVSVDMADYNQIAKFGAIKAIYLEGTILNIISELRSFDSEFARSSSALMQISTPDGEQVKIYHIEQMLDIINAAGRKINVIWGTSVVDDIPAGNATLFIVYSVE